MSRLDQNDAILDVEFRWFGSHLGVPRVQGSETSFSAGPTVRNGVSSSHADENDEPNENRRQIRLIVTDDGWRTEIDGA